MGEGGRVGGGTSMQIDAHLHAYCNTYFRQEYLHIYKCDIWAEDEE